MRRILIMLVLLVSLAVVRADAVVTGKIVKVLPLLLTLQGHDALSPSLFDRDAYQAYLRAHTNEISAVRYDVLWKAAGTDGTNVTLRVELQGIGPDGSPRAKTLETAVTTGFFRSWTSLELGGDDYKNFGAVMAWRVTLWSGGQQLSEQHSFLW